MTGKNLIKIIEQLFLMCYMLKNEYIYPVYISKHNLNQENQIIFLRIPSREGRHYH